MRKSTLFVSAVLTTFVMAMLVSVASAYQSVVNSDQITAQAQPQAQPQEKAVSQTISVEAQPVNITPEEASALAAQVLGHDDLFSVEVADLNGETVFMVTFSSGDLVYVSLDGQIRSIGKVEVETVVINSGRERDSDDNIQPPNSSQSQKEHEDHEDRDDDREDHDDD